MIDCSSSSVLVFLTLILRSYLCIWGLEGLLLIWGPLRGFLEDRVVFSVWTGWVSWGGIWEEVSFLAVRDSACSDEPGPSQGCSWPSNMREEVRPRGRISFWGVTGIVDGRVSTQCDCPLEATGLATLAEVVLLRVQELARMVLGWRGILSDCWCPRCHRHPVWMLHLPMVLHYRFSQWC